MPTGTDGRAHPPLVVVYDDRVSRSRLVVEAAIAAGAGIVARPIAAVDAMPAAPCLAVVAVDSGGESPAPSALASIRTLTGVQVRVIAYGDGAGEWPLGVRCRILLAGAAAVLDSARTGFSTDLLAKLVQTLDTEATRRREEEQLHATFHKLGIIGQSDAMRTLFRWATRVSGLSDLHVLITGETGTGKQLFAEALHALDPKRRDGPFVALNCGAISPGLAESELFGHRRGAFTGADRDRKGLIRAAHGGVLFLDEIGELDPALQTKVLRVLQEGRVLGVGEDQETPVSLRVIAATNRNLEAMVRQRTFRADLFHRLEILSIELPPVRERPGDISPLVAHFLAKHGHLGRHGVTAASDEFVAALSEDGLPGNVRQLENLVRRAIVHKENGEPLSLVDLPPEVWANVSHAPAASVDGLTSAPEPTATATPAEPQDASSLLALNGWNLARSLASCERSLVEAALRAADGNQSETARLLGITPRCVYNKIRKHRLQNERSDRGIVIPEPPSRTHRAR
jgi:DNA-binding NtrC family response regulator